MSWLFECRIAGCIVQVDSDSDACKKAMLKFLCLYESVEGCLPDLRFSVIASEEKYSFVFTAQDGIQQTLWESADEDEVSAALEIHLYSRLVQFLDTQNIVSIHASVLNIHDSAIMFAGASGAGKSSLCTAALLDGSAYLSDEFTLLDKEGSVHPFPRPMQWEHPTHPAFDRDEIKKSGLIKADYFDFPAASGEITRCHLWHPKYIERKILPLQYVVLHQYQADLDAATIVSIPRHEALLELPNHLHIQHGLGKDLPRLNQRIAASCKFYKLNFPSAKDAWSVMKNEIERMLK